MASPTRVLTRITIFAQLAFAGYLAFSYFGGSGKQGGSDGPDRPRAAYSEPGCAPVADGPLLQDRLPNIAEDFTVMAQLPLTGAPLYQVVADPANEVNACVTDTMSGGGETMDETMTVGDEAGRTATFHEAFHTAQHAAEHEDYLRLPTRDYLMHDLLSEAAASAYQLISEQEAENHKIPFSTAGGYASDDGDMRAEFNRAYDAAHAQGKDEQKSLEAAGQAAVRYLLSGREEDWKDSYVRLCLKHALLIDLTLQPGERFKAEDPDYLAFRTKMFTAAGHVSDEINLTPSELLGPDFEAATGEYLRAVGLKAPEDAQRLIPARTASSVPSI